MEGLDLKDLAGDVAGEVRQFCEGLAAVLGPRLRRVRRSGRRVGQGRLTIDRPEPFIEPALAAEVEKV